jgi:nitroimidazol reductase NimA-like FMN-containing flavoprotein (pyridoxamine 5'-phosphate oxidase superfamily)
MDTALKEKILGVLDRSPDMTVCTVRPDGAPQATVVSFVHDGLNLYFGTGARSQKSENIAHDPRVSITVTAPYADWLQIEGISLFGIASEIEDVAGKVHVAELMMRRFPKIGAIQVIDPYDMKLFRVRPTVVSVLDYTKGFGHSDLVTIGPDDLIESAGAAIPDLAKAS